MSRVIPSVPVGGVGGRDGEGGGVGELPSHLLPSMTPGRSVKNPTRFGSEDIPSLVFSLPSEVLHPPPQDLPGPET